MGTGSLEVLKWHTPRVGILATSTAFSEFFSKTTKSILPAVPHFGCWKSIVLYELFVDLTLSGLGNTQVTTFDT